MLGGDEPGNTASGGGVPPSCPQLDAGRTTVPRREEYRGASREELEGEAIEEERKETKDDDPIVEYSTGRNRYRMRESEARRIERMVESELAEWVECQERAMPEEEYLKLLYKYREYLERKA